MSLTKKDPSLRVAASDPHLVSLGGGRLSTAVTLHYIHIGDTTIGSAASCSISLNGSGVRPLHCTIYRSDANEVTLVPEQDSRLLIDGTPILEETKLSQGAMITIGNSNYLRFNNPDEAQMMRSAMGSNERISMPQIDFTQSARQAHELSQSLELESFYESIINPINNPSTYELECPKVFSSDLVTVNMPAKDVLGQKYASFARNLAENHRNEKQLNNQFAKGVGNNSGYWNVPSNAAIYKEQQQQQAPPDLLTKVNNDRYDRYPKAGGLQIYSMNGVNSDINNGLVSGHNSNPGGGGGGAELEDMLKICTEYADRNNSMAAPTHNTSSTSSITSSPIVQNRIKTNGSLPRDKNKSPFPQQTGAGSSANISLLSSSSGYENVRLLGPNRVEINGQIHVPASAGGGGSSSGVAPTAAVRASHENLNQNNSGTAGGKYVPQSPRTKIRTNCMSPKKDVSFGNAFALAISPPPTQASNAVSSAPIPIPIPSLVKPPLAPKPPAPNQQRDYEQLFKSFERKQQQLDRLVPAKRSNKNINNLTLNLQSVESQTQSPKPSRKPAPAPRSIHLEQRQRRDLIQRRKQLKRELAELPPSAGIEGLELELGEQPLAASASPRLQLQALQNRVRRLEAQRNATRVMEENQQAKLKQSIEMKQDQLKKLRAMLKQKPNNACLKEELQLVCESLESDRKTFEDLEFQYFEEESEHHASHEEFKRQEQRLALEAELAALRIQIGPDEEEPGSPSSPGSTGSNLVNGVMSQSLFGSAELLCPKRRNQEDLMSKSVNENMFYNHKIEANTSTPKRLPLQLFEDLGGGSCEQISFNLSLQGDRFEVNPLERRVPSQDDIDRSCKVANDAPISTSQGASTKIFDSIKEIERNRKLLLAQQGHQVIEHERQKMYDLKKKSHDEARTQYLLSTQQSMEQQLLLLESDANGGKDAKLFEKTEMQKLNKPGDTVDEQVQKTGGDKENNVQNRKSTGSSPTTATTTGTTPQQQRHSQPELEHHAIALGMGGVSGGGGGNQMVVRSPRPLSEANNCDATLEAPKFVNGMDSSASPATENKRASSNSHDTASAGSGSGNSGSGGSTASERKRILPKHQRPLTRYLPIFSPDLNLRHHIETAGHQIDLCPHVFVDAHSCRGYLHKLGATFHAWSRRWFVLDRQRSALIYYSDKSERKPRGGAYFATIDEVYLDHLNASKSGRPHCTFIVKTKKRSYNLQAASDSAARIWIDAIITGAQGNLDY
ncbi:pleckstrin homology-like domain family B member 2 isoform X1 [Drosophila rhopaloa]|uniref:Pleckstrin homology-like domain family B member 2 isoform X1 n=1 Tax=Drosophila rhopaloa TaxID=1041015 RepID=A0A6P4EPG6_DRORH|nr:pleckstrin homology-like domain family B member 2 isoform X1 [Drosophila rhopaloa]